MIVETETSARPSADGPRSEPEHVRAARRRVRVLFINDTARNGGPGRSLFYILRFLDPAVVERTVVLPRPGVISELYEERGVTDELLFEPDLVASPQSPEAIRAIQELTRAMLRRLPGVMRH